MKRSKFLKRLVSIALVAFLAFPVSAFAGCNSNEQNKVYNNEEDALVFSTQEVDKVFNPFFSTSATDSSVVGMTQIGMLTNDKEGGVAFGPDEAVVTEVYEFYYDPNKDTTTYYFVLKNNVRFSNGSYLSMKDVLFNYYVYLDPVYSGSSTIYSTDIVGLKQYRTQEDNEKEQDNFKAQFEAAASDRITYLAEVAAEILDDHKSENLTEASFRELLEQYVEENNVDAYKHLVEDYDAALPMFKEELQRDFNNSKDTYSELIFISEKDGMDVEHKGVITTDVEMFLYNENFLRWDRKEGVMKSSLTNDAAELKNWTEEQAIKAVYDSKVPSAIGEIVLYWGTATELFDTITNKEMQDYFKDKPRKYTNISGIQFANRTQAVTLPSGKIYEPPQYEDEAQTHVKDGFNEVLTITINKVDPKAKWNFSLGIAPLYYYSDAAHIKAFDYESNFGVEYSSQDFMTDVIKAPEKVGVPVGAGMYAASTSAGGIDAKNITVGTFCDNNIIYFERNPYFLMGPAKIKKVRYQVIGSSAMLSALYTHDIDFIEPNAKTETVDELEAKASEGIYSDHYMTSGYGYIGVNAGKVPSIAVRQAIMHAVNTQECITYYGTTAEPIYRAMSKANWAYPKNATAYYPYIGGEIPGDLSKVNPDYAKFVQKKGKKAGEKFTEEEQIEFIVSLVEGAGFTKGGDGVYVNASGHKLKYTFTIAGEQQDHPAWLALYKAGLFLDRCGFSITTTTDANALRKLASGELTVWAAAWGSTIDPDMYQVYHRDSTATSTLNWGYKQIKQNAGGKYDLENSIINDLSDLIEQAREMEDQDQRAALYSKALDKVMELAVELPTYQRDDLFACNANKIDVNTFIPKSERTPYQGMTSKLYQVSLRIA